jgi:hypothetical protein
MANLAPPIYVRYINPLRSPQRRATILLARPYPFAKVKIVSYISVDSSSSFISLAGVGIPLVSLRVIWITPNHNAVKKYKD